MINQFYPNPNVKHKPHIPYTPPPYQITQQQSTFNNNSLSIAAIRASKIGISTAEWQRRDAIVKATAADTEFDFMDSFYPCSLDWYKQYGKCVFLGKPLGYHECDTEDWPTDDKPLVFTVRALAPATPSDGLPFFCNKHFMSKEAPTNA